MENEYGEYEQVNGAVVNCANKRIRTLEIQLAKAEAEVQRITEEGGARIIELEAKLEKAEGLLDEIANARVGWTPKGFDHMVNRILAKRRKEGE